MKIQDMKWKLLLWIGIILCFNTVHSSGSKLIKTSARSIAMHAGAAQFKESIEEMDRANRRDRRLADSLADDDDYEVYQGVVGRPGIDFPVLRFIPKTTFNCRQMGNGYFADLETDCQVFHICDTGRKISFLCPNGTIFKQSELICDWWFKVDCVSSPNKYVQSKELLAKYRNREPVTDAPINRPERTRSPSRTATPRPTLQSIENASVQLDNSNENVDFPEVPSRNPSARRPTPTTQRSTLRTSRPTLQSLEDTSVQQETSGEQFNSPEDVAHHTNARRPDPTTRTSTRPTSQTSEIPSRIPATRQPEPTSRSRTATPRPTVQSLENADNQQSTTNSNIHFPDDTPPNPLSTRRPAPNLIRKSEGGTPRTQPPTTSSATTERLRNSIDTNAVQNIEDDINLKTDVNDSDLDDVDAGEFSTETQELAESGPLVKPGGGFNFNQAEDLDAIRKLSNRNKYDDDIIIEIPDSITERPTTKSNFHLNTVTTVKPTTYSRGLSRGSSRFNGNTDDVQKTDDATRSKIKSVDSRLDVSEPLDITGPGRESEDSKIIRIVPESAFDTSVNNRGTNAGRNINTNSRNRVSVSRKLSTTSPAADKQDDLVLTTSTPSFNRDNAYSTAKRLGTTKSNVFYTPTVPTPSNRFNPDRSEQLILPPPTESSPSEHAIEMMKTLQELDTIDELLPPFVQDKIQDPRPGLNIPPSSGPDTLHSLALYFATAADSISRDNDTDVKSLDHNHNITETLLTSKIMKKYDQLFSAELSSGEKNGTSPVNSRGSYESTEKNEIEREMTHIFNSAGSPQVRELAQVFTHALSAYLHDPVEFRKILKEIRPKEPEADDFLNNRIGRTKSPATATTPVSTNGATYLPTTSSPLTPTTTFTDHDLEVLDFSDVTLSTQKYTKAIDLLESTSTMSTTAVTSDPDIESTTVDIETTTSSPDLKLNNQPFNRKAKKTPGSDLIARILDEDEATTTDVPDTTTTSSTYPSNSLAMEINGNLLLSTTFPITALDLVDLSDDKKLGGGGDIGNYFPTADDGKDTTSKPYGDEFKLTNRPIAKYQTLGSLPSRWGGDGQETTTTVDGPDFETTTIGVPELNDLKDVLIPNAEILPPGDLDESTTVENEEGLQRAQSQSIVASKNNENDRRGKKISKEAAALNIFTEDKRSSTTERELGAKSSTVKPLSRETIRGHYITQTFPTPTTSGPQTSTTEQPTTVYPWSQLAYTIFLDPLTINDGLMESATDHIEETHSSEKLIDSTTTQPEDTTTIVEPTSASVVKLNRSETTTSQPGTSRPPTNTRRGKSFPTTQFPGSRFGIEDEKHVAEPTEIMQERANEIFGNLNETQANSLMNVMKKADSNQKVRKLILLLIQTCDDDYNKTVEESRQALLNALIGMDHDVNDIQIINTRRGKNIVTTTLPPAAITQTTEIPSTTNRGDIETDSTSTPFSTMINSSGETSTVGYSTTTTFDRGSAETTTEFRIDLSEENESTTTSSSATISNFIPTDAAAASSVENVFVSTTTTYVAEHSTTPATTTTSGQQHIRRGKSLEGFLSNSQTLGSITEYRQHSDERALELLKSLYSLASKWGQR